MRMQGGFYSLLTAGLLAGAALALPGTAAAASQQTLVDRSTLAIQDLFAEARPNSRIVSYLARSRAVLVCPSIFQMSIAIGGSGGGCVLLARDARGSWSDPAFYTLSTASIGVQLGMQDSEAMFFVMTDRGLQALLDSQFQFGANASASFATMGSGIESGTAGESHTDIMAVQKSKGLFAGASLGSSKLTVNSGANRNYYNQMVGPEDIVIAMRVNNPGADPLRSILTRFSTPVQQQALPAPAPMTGGAAGYSAQGAQNYPAQSYQAAPETPGGAIQSQSLPPITSGR